MTKEASFEFKHGVGDCALFAPALKLWTSRGYKITVDCHNDHRKYFFQAMGVEIGKANGRHPYWPGNSTMFPAMGEDWLGNKLGNNLNQRPLPSLSMSMGEMWREYLRVRPTIDQYATDEEKERIDKWVKSQGGPIVVLHTRGNTSTSEKNFSAELEEATYSALMSNTAATTLLLDWDNRVSMPKYTYQHGDKLTRIVHMKDWHRLGLPELAYLLKKAALFVGIDSGPLHLATKWTDCKVLGVWFDHHPAHFAIPRQGATHLVESKKKFMHWNRERKASYNLVECPKITGERIAEMVKRVVG